MTRNHDALYHRIHRTDYQAILHRLARTAPDVRICLGAPVRAVQPDPAVQGGSSVTLACGEVLYADLIVHADSVKSTWQKAITGFDDTPTPTGDAAHRAVMYTDLMLGDSELHPFVETPEMTAWMVPGRHLMAYCIRAKKEYNLVLLHPDDRSVESWTEEGSRDKMRTDFADFEPRIQKLLSFVKSTLKLSLMDRKPLPTWIHPKGRLVLLGDECRPMLAPRSQSEMQRSSARYSHMSRHSHKFQTPSPSLPGPPVTARVNNARLLATQPKIFPLPDGPAQLARDEAMRTTMAAELEGGKPIPTDGDPNQWAGRTKSRIQFGYDVYAEVERWWTAGDCGVDGGCAGMMVKARL